MSKDSSLQEKALTWRGDCHLKWLVLLHAIPVFIFAFAKSLGIHYWDCWYLEMVCREQPCLSHTQLDVEMKLGQHWHSTHTEIKNAPSTPEGFAPPVAHSKCISTLSVWHCEHIQEKFVRILFVCFKILFLAGEMAHHLKCLLYKQEDLNVDAQNPHRCSTGKMAFFSF